MSYRYFVSGHANTIEHGIKAMTAQVEMGQPITALDQVIDLEKIIIERDGYKGLIITGFQLLSGPQVEAVEGFTEDTTTPALARIEQRVEDLVAKVSEALAPIITAQAGDDHMDQLAEMIRTQPRRASSFVDGRGLRYSPQLQLQSEGMAYAWHEALVDVDSTQSGVAAQAAAGKALLTLADHIAAGLNPGAVRGYVEQLAHVTRSAIRRCNMAGQL